MTGINFVCKIQGDDKAIKETIKSTRFSFPKAHTNSNDIAELSKEVKKHDKNTICVVPFCSTVEVEALGAKVNLGDEKIGPRVNSFAYESIEQLSKIEKINLEEGRIKEVLDSIEKLNNEGEIVTLNVSGPFIIITSLVDPMIFYKAVRKNKELVDKVITMIEDNIINYVKEGIRRGAKIISYEDSVGSVEIVGPKVYRDLTGKVTSEVLKKIGEFDNIVVHICGKTSVALEKYEFAKSTPVKLKEDVTYGQAIIDIIKKQKDIKFIGHSCMKRTPDKLKNNIVWKIDLS